MHLKDHESGTIVGPRQLNMDPWSCKGLLLIGRRRGLESPRRHFRPQKIDKKTLNSVTVHL